MSQAALVCDNSTVDSVVGCHNNGWCVARTDIGQPDTFVCVCNMGWNYLDGCATTVYDVVGVPVYVAIMIFTAIFFSFMVLLLIPEIVVELIYDRRISWKQPYIVTKFLYLLTALSNSYPMYKLTYAAFHGENPYGIDIIATLDLATLLFGICFSLIIIGWLTIVIRAKNLGEKTKAAIIFRLCNGIAAIVLIFVFGAAYVVKIISLSSTSKELRSLALIMENIHLAIKSLYSLVVVVGSLYFVIVVLRWTIKDKEKGSLIVAKVRNKAWWIIVSFVGFCTLSAFQAAQLLFFTYTLTPTAYMWIVYGSLLSDFIIIYAFFMVLQRFTYNPAVGWFRGYIYAVQGRLKELDGKFSKTKQSHRNSSSLRSKSSKSSKNSTTTSAASPSKEDAATVDNKHTMSSAQTETNKGSASGSGSGEARSKSASPQNVASHSGSKSGSKSDSQSASGSEEVSGNESKSE